MVTTYLLFFLYCLSVIRKLTLDECSFIYSHFLLLKVFLQCGLHAGLKCQVNSTGFLAGSTPWPPWLLWLLSPQHGVCSI